MHRLVGLALALVVSFVPLPQPAAATTPTDISITEYQFTPTPTSVILGESAVWTNNGAVMHSSVQDGPLKLWATPGIAPGGGQASVVISWAGTFTYHCFYHPTLMHGTVTSAPTASPPTGPPGTMFTITWATAAPPAGEVFRVQMRRHLQYGNFTAWAPFMRTKQLSGQTTPAAGTYDFRARVENKKDPKKRSGWSPLASITIA